MEKFIVTKANVNFRKEPNTKSSVIQLLKAGEVLEVIGEAPGTWYKAKRSNGQVGYISSLMQYTTITTPEWLQEARKVVELGSTFLGTPYLFGSTRNHVKTFDCSDLVQYVFRHGAGIQLGGDSRKQSLDAPEVSLDVIRTGDLTFFEKDGKIYHVSIYVHDDKLLHTYNNTAIVYDEDLKPTGQKGGVTFTRFSGYWKDKAGLCKIIRPIRV